jgi:GNAT superfamily N-acetyltransferase
MEWVRNGYKISTDPDLVSLDAVCRFMANSYWAENRAREVIAKSIENSLNFGIYKGDKQVGYARVVTDYATAYWLCDVFIDLDYRGDGLGKWLMDCLTGYPRIKDLMGILATRDAHGLYEQYGFVVPEDPKKFMWKRRK